MGIHKSWWILESRRLEFRCELFNALNHPNFFLPSGDLSNSKTFGVINQAFPARSVQFAGKFYF